MAAGAGGAAGEGDKSKTLDPGRWGKFSAALTALNPVLLLIIGFYLNSGIEQTKVQIEQTSAKVRDLKVAADAASVAAHDRIDKVKVLQDFLKDLSGDDERRRVLAIQVVNILLPEEAPRLEKVVLNFASRRGPAADDKDAAAAKDALASTRDKLVADMFSTSRQTRVDALHTLERGWTNDAPIIDLLIARSKLAAKKREAANWAILAPDDENYRDLAGIFNTVAFLTDIRAQIDSAQKSRIIDFAKTVQQNSDDTRRYSMTLIDRLK